MCTKMQISVEVFRTQKKFKTTFKGIRIQPSNKKRTLSRIGVLILKASRTNEWTSPSNQNAAMSKTLMEKERKNFEPRLQVFRRCFQQGY